MLRHACGFKLGKAGVDTRAWLGHRNTQHTVRYAGPAPDRFKDFWRDEWLGGRWGCADTTGNALGYRAALGHQ
jgi:hypothetical protein